MTDKQNPLPHVMYGIWIPKHGWWKAKNPKSGQEVAYAEFRPEIARRYARWVGSGARVEVIDESLIANEKQLLSFEEEKFRRIREVWKKQRSALRESLASIISFVSIWKKKVPRLKI